MIQSSAPLALITGASSGIGEAIARRLGAGGARLVLAARRVDRLQTLADEITAAHGEALIIPADLSTEAGCQALYEQVMQACGVPDILINNAGLGWYGYLAEMPWDDARNLIQVNIAAVVQLTRLFLPGMRARRSGHVINIGSIAGQIPSQGTAVYAGSKGFLDAFTTALHREMQGSGVRISLVCPGPVKTEFFDQSEQIGRRIPAERFAVPASRVAESVAGLLHRSRRVVYVPWFLAITPWVERLFGWAMDGVGPLLLRQKRHPKSL